MSDVASSSTQISPHASDEQNLNEICRIVWGSNIRLDVFQRWSQGIFHQITFNIKFQ